jgi:hypothetical protein
VDVKTEKTMREAKKTQPRNAIIAGSPLRNAMATVRTIAYASYEYAGASSYRIFKDTGLKSFNLIV